MERDAIGFSTWIFVQASLPSSDPGNDMGIWTRRNGDILLTVEQGHRLGPNDEIQKIGYPYGVIPRLILIYLATEAVRTKSPRIELGGSVREFMRRVRLRPEGRTYRMLRIQMERLTAANIRFSYRQAVVGIDASVSQRHALWWHTSGTHRYDSQSHIVLNAQLFETIVRRPLPLDMDAIALLTQSPLALDLYCWLAARAYKLERVIAIPWRAISAQVGSTYADPANFRKKARHALRLVQLAWPTLNVGSAPGCLLLYPCPTPVPPIA